MATASTFDANNADTRQIARWLETALDGYIKDDMGRWAFRPLERYIGLRDHLVDDLRAIYDSLTASAQGRWRDAIRDILALHGRDISKRKTTRVLITLATLIRSQEVLDVLPGILSGSQDHDLLDLTVEAATSLASQTEASRRCLKQIRTSPTFTSHYAGLILVALCHADPDNWPHHVKELGIAMGKLASRLDPDSTALRFYANDILQSISLSRITVAALNSLATESDGQAAWLLKEWLEGDQSLLRLHPTTTGTRLVLRTDDSIFAELERSLDTALLKAHGLPTYRRTAIAWEYEGNRKAWVAVCISGVLTKLTPIEPQESLMAFLSDYLNEQNSVQWQETYVLKHGGVAFDAPDELQLIVTGDELLALWNHKIGNRSTDRIGYLDRNPRVKPALRYLAFQDRHAFNVTASALALAEGRLASPSVVESS